MTLDSVYTLKAAIYYTHTDIIYTICLLENSIFKIVWDLNYACLNQNI
jgi:hypothetical protein